jgi:4-hydroxy-tetrahydrodipicolinate synthase
MIKGSIVAIVTPMHADGSLDLPGLRKLIDWHIAEGTDGIVIVGTTGESPTVSVEEHCELIKVAVEHTNKRIPIIAGTGGNSTSEAITLTRYAKDVGADASLLVVPYYNRPTQEGMYQHFKKIAEAVDLPVILYNVPGRTVADMHNDTILRLAQIPGIIGVAAKMQLDPIALIQYSPISAITEPYRNAMTTRQREYAADMILVFMRDYDAGKIGRRHADAEQSAFCFAQAKTAIEHHGSARDARYGAD